MNSVVTWEGQKIQSSRGNPHRTRTNCGLTATHEVHQRVDLKFCLLKSIQVQVHAPLWLRLAQILSQEFSSAVVEMVHHVSVCASLHFHWNNLQESESFDILQKKHGSDDEVAYNTCCSSEYLRLSPLPKVLCSWKLCWPPRMPGTHWQTPSKRGVKPRSEKKTGGQSSVELSMPNSLQWEHLEPLCQFQVVLLQFTYQCGWIYVCINIYISTAIWNKGQMSGCIYQSTSFKKSPTQL